METTVVGFAALLRQTNRTIALVVGMVLLATGGLIIADIILRQFSMSLGGSDEISGYAMATIASWGMSFGLTELAHVRIDVIRLRLAPFWQSCLDVFSILVLSAVVGLIAIQAWPVLAKTIERGSRANTPLETPLWIPQLIWYSGWLWFAVSAAVLTIVSIICLGRRQFSTVSSISGIGSEIEETTT